jgi:hypothetical protein
MKWLMRFAILYLVSLVILFAVVAMAGGGSVGPGDPHTRMNPVSHSDYELHRSIGHVI